MSKRHIGHNRDKHDAAEMEEREAIAALHRAKKLEFLTAQTAIPVTVLERLDTDRLAHYFNRCADDVRAKTQIFIAGIFVAASSFAGIAAAIGNAPAKSHLIIAAVFLAGGAAIGLRGLYKLNANKKMTGEIVSELAKPAPKPGQ